jgi:hypothetical protein
MWLQKAGFTFKHEQATPSTLRSSEEGRLEDENRGQTAPPADKKPHVFNFLGKAVGSRLQRSISRHGKTAAAPIDPAPAPQTSSDSRSGSFDQLLQQATPAKLLSLIRDIELPETLTAEQVDRVRSLLGMYHEDALTDSPMIDVLGNQIPLRRDRNAVESDAWPHIFNEVAAQIKRSLGLKEKFSFAPDVSYEALLRRVDRILENYPLHKAWLKKSLKIRKVKPEDVSAGNAGVVGQDGVFATHDIPAGTAMFFGGMLISDPADAALDQRIRELAECDFFYAGLNRWDPTSVPLIEGMDITMKMNAAYDEEQSLEGDTSRNNLSIVLMPVVRTDTGEQMNLIFLFSNRPIKRGEQLCYMYGTGNAHYFSLNREQVRVLCREIIEMMKKSAAPGNVAKEA